MQTSKFTILESFPKHTPQTFLSHRSNASMKWQPSFIHQWKQRISQPRMATSPTLLSANFSLRTKPNKAGTMLQVYDPPESSKWPKPFYSFFPTRASLSHGRCVHSCSTFAHDTNSFHSGSASRAWEKLLSQNKQGTASPQLPACLLSEPRLGSKGHCDRNLRQTREFLKAKEKRRRNTGARELGCLKDKWEWHGQFGFSRISTKLLPLIIVSPTIKKNESITSNQLWWKYVWFSSCKWREARRCVQTWFPPSLPISCVWSKNEIRS